MLAPQFAELSHAISTLGRSFWPGRRAKMSMSSASAPVAQTTIVKATPTENSARRSHFRNCGRTDGLPAEIVRIGFLDSYAYTLIHRDARARRRIVHPCADVPLRIRAQRVARSDRGVVQVEQLAGPA